jgi:hypothetical protein
VLQAIDDHALARAEGVSNLRQTVMNRPQPGRAENHFILLEDTIRLHANLYPVRPLRHLP